jgi:hypothetical protein
MQVDQVEENNLSSDGALNWFWAGEAPELTRVGLYCRYLGRQGSLVVRALV